MYKTNNKHIKLFFLLLLFVYLLHLHAQYKINIISLPVQNKIFTLQFYWHNQMFNYNIISKLSWENNQGRQVFLTHMSSKTAMCTCWGLGRVGGSVAQIRYEFAPAMHHGKLPYSCNSPSR